MQCTRNVTDHIIWVGANDRRVNLFENLFPIPRGVSYNAYLIKDEKNTLMDTVDASASGQFIENVAYALNGESLDYLVVQHMEPDHCANIQRILELYPEAKSSRKCEDHADDRTVFRCGSGRQEGCSKRRRYTGTWKPYASFCNGTDGTLAGGYGLL